MEPAAVREERCAHWEEKLAALADATGIDLGKLSAQKSHPDKALLAAAMKLTSSVSNRWLSERLDMGQPASASQFARRFGLTETGSAAVARLLSRVET